MTALLGALAVLAASFVKGAIGFGFPTVATPVLSLVVDVKTAIAVLIVPNLVMDVILASRRGGFAATARRLWPLLAAGIAGMVLGTRLLVWLSPRTATIILGVSALLFVALNATRWTPRLPAVSERWLAPLIGLLGGLVGGVTNVPGTVVIMFFYALGLEKLDFVRAAAFTFIVYKATQLGAVAWYGLLSWPLLGASVGLTALGLGAFRLGVAVQDRLDQQMFNRAVLAFLAAVGGWLIVRSLG